MLNLVLTTIFVLLKTSLTAVLMKTFLAIFIIDVIREHYLVGSEFCELKFIRGTALCLGSEPYAKLSAYSTLFLSGSEKVAEFVDLTTATRQPLFNVIKQQGLIQQLTENVKGMDVKEKEHLELLFEDLQTEANNISIMLDEFAQDLDFLLVRLLWANEQVIKDLNQSLLTTAHKVLCDSACLPFLCPSAADKKVTTDIVFLLHIMSSEFKELLNDTVPIIHAVRGFQEHLHNIRLTLVNDTRTWRAWRSFTSPETLLIVLGLKNPLTDTEATIQFLQESTAQITHIQDQISSANTVINNFKGDSVHLVKVLETVKQVSVNYTVSNYTTSHDIESMPKKAASKNIRQGIVYLTKSFAFLSA